MWQQGWRDRVWAQITMPWDLLVIGGGITGAGILREATRLGLRTLLVEQRDFAWGTSSRSSKLVHGGLRYLQEGQVRLTRASVRERQRLLREGPGLIEPLGFLLATYKGDRPGRWTYTAGLSVYDLLALQWSHQHYRSEDFQFLAPHIAQNGLTGGFRFGDAQTDDARLVLRVLQEAVKAGGQALNYARAEQLLTHNGQVTGVRLSEDPAAGGRSADVHARAVINATGPWADTLRTQAGVAPRIRPLRGSHLVFPSYRLAIPQAVSFLHPEDHRPVFIFPWEGITLVGTTDLDHDLPLDREPGITPEEVDYLLEAVAAQFPSLEVGPADVMATFAGVRPVVGSGRADPSRESRDHVVWEEQGLLTVTGGKLTTFRLIAHDALSAIRGRFPNLPAPDRKARVLDPVDFERLAAGPIAHTPRGSPAFPAPAAGVRLRRLSGRYGVDAFALLAAAEPADLEPVSGLPVIWAELRWAARAEAVVHLDDLLLRRVRLGLLLPEGARPILPRVRALCQAELGWDDARWEAEEAAYLALWRQAYSLPDSQPAAHQSSNGRVVDQGR